MKIYFLLCCAFFFNVVLGFFVITPKCENIKQLNVAVASNFSYIFLELKCLFEKKTDVTLLPSVGSSGLLYNQIKNNAKFDVFMSADNVRPSVLCKEGYGLKQFMCEYSVGRLVFFSKSKKIYVYNNSAVMFSATIDLFKMAVPNKDLSPYGYTVSYVLKRTLNERLTVANLITGENVGQTFNFVVVGNVDAGFSSLSQLTFAERVLFSRSIFILPKNSTVNIVQSLVILNTTRMPISRCFFDFVKSCVVKKFMFSYGYSIYDDFIFLRNTGV
jgi:molybdate transport system substrate-binding protein